MLLTLLRLPKTVTSTTVLVGQQDGLVRSFVPYSGRPFTLESQLFSRWTRPSQRAVSKGESAAVAIEESQEPDSDSLRSVVSTLTALISQAPEELPYHAQYWSRLLPIKMSAALGQAIYPHGRESANFLRDFTHSKPSKKNIDFGKGLVFSPEASGLLPFLKQSKCLDQERLSLLKVVLLPSPLVRGPDVIRKYPEIFLYFNVRPASLELADVFATVMRSHTNLLLPSKRVDIRIDTRYLVQGSKDLHDHPNIRQFCSELRRSYCQTGSKLRAPLSLKLPILKARGESPQLGNEEEEKVDLENEEKGRTELEGKIGNRRASTSKPIMVEYLFARLEQQQTLGFEFEGHKLEYNSVEGGRIGGSYDMVDLKFCSPLPSIGQSMSQDSKHDDIRPLLQSQEVSNQPQQEPEFEVQARPTDQLSNATGIVYRDIPETELEGIAGEKEGKGELQHENIDLSGPLSSGVQHFVQSALRLVELASNPRPSVHTQATGWLPGATKYFKSIQKYDPESDINEHDREASQDISLAEKTVMDVTNERISEWRGVQERQKQRRKAGMTMQDLLDEAGKERANFKTIGVAKEEGLRESVEVKGSEDLDARREVEDDGRQ